MNKSIDPVIERLIKIDFLAHAGSIDPVTASPCQTIRLKSWREAVDLRGSNEASNAFMEARAILSRRLSAGHRSEYRKWNKISAHNRTVMGERVFPMVNQRIDRIAELQSIDRGGDFIKYAVRWDLLHFASEQAYSEFVPPGFILS